MPAHFCHLIISAVSSVFSVIMVGNDYKKPLKIMVVSTIYKYKIQNWIKLDTLTPWNLGAPPITYRSPSAAIKLLQASPRLIFFLY